MKNQNLMTWAEVDLDAIAHNARGLKERAGENTELMAVVKANAYGHGAVPVARTALENGASRLAVNRALEGVELRQAAVTAPILILGYSLPSEAEAIVRWELTPTVTTVEGALALSAMSDRQGKVTSIHVKVDTGMGRFGLLPDEVVPFVRRIAELPGLKLEGLFTHFAVADSSDKTYTRRQFDRYMEVVKQLDEAGFTIPLKHVANSAANLDLPEMHLDMVRCGIALYGLRPSDEVEPAIPLKPAMALKSRVARVRTLPPGSSISYGCTYTTIRPTLVALVPVGYGDGYHRILSNKGSVLIGGKRAPIVGRVCMDQFVVDVTGHFDRLRTGPSTLLRTGPSTLRRGSGQALLRTGIVGVRQDDEVVVFGRQGEEEISAEEVAALAGTINYEVVTSILPRVTRVYLKGGQVVEVRPLVED